MFEGLGKDVRVDLVAIGEGVDAIGGEMDFAFGRFVGLIDEFALLFELDDFESEVDGGDAVVVGEEFHGGSGSRAETLCEVLFIIDAEGVDEADVGAGVCFPGLSDDAFHGGPDFFGRSAAIVDCELDEEKVGFVLEDVVAVAENAEVTASAADSCVDFMEVGLGKFFAEPFHGLDAPPVGCGDGAAEVGDVDVFAVVEFLEDVAQAITWLDEFCFDLLVGWFVGV